MSNQFTLWDDIIELMCSVCLVNLRQMTSLTCLSLIPKKGTCVKVDTFLRKLGRLFLFGFCCSSRIHVDQFLQVCEHSSRTYSHWGDQTWPVDCFADVRCCHTSEGNQAVCRLTNGDTVGKRPSAGKQFAEKWNLWSFVRCCMDLWRVLRVSKEAKKKIKKIIKRKK